MRKVWMTVVFLAIFFSGYWLFLRKPATVDAPQSISQSKIKIGTHSAAFNNSIDTLVNAYLALKDDFVKADSVSAKTAATRLISLTDSVKLDEFKKDTTGIYLTAQSQLGDVKTNAQSLIADSNITDMRKDFKGITENLYPLLKMIHYEGKVLYLQNCPMAFGENNDANWISNTTVIINPYLNNNTPDFKTTMIHCGETKDSLVAK